jgi:predicted unusual protein kinase regulating ubiquinone biosynthesis (AarF/ABC1/UbiB family)
LPEQVFKRFDAEPFAAASLGQVHRAVMRDGTGAAVKIQYPGIRAAIENDFRWIRNITLPARASGHLPKATLDEMESQIVAETDYVREADHIEFFRAALKPLDFVVVPDVYRDCSTDRVLTMSVVAGQHLDAFPAKHPSQRLRDLVGSRLLELFTFQLLILEVLHADPHWETAVQRRRHDRAGGFRLREAARPRRCPHGGQRAAGSRSITISVNDPGSTGPRPLPVPPVGAGPNFAETMNTR